MDCRLKGSKPTGRCDTLVALSKAHTYRFPGNSTDGLQETETPFCQKAQNRTILELEGLLGDRGPIPVYGRKVKSLKRCKSPR